MVNISTGYMLQTSKALLQVNQLSTADAAWVHSLSRDFVICVKLVLFLVSYVAIVLTFLIWYELNMLFSLSRFRKHRSILINYMAFKMLFKVKDLVSKLDKSEK